ncbi:uncharacterized protein LOC135702504 [Ochlerotatus camptorhynchus]|uniref:uncharacterized protein LOC135702504 n=1 Tax=Ochlerotatus camptorhynchus TaxID=644619 RepID=UPI0031DFFBAF
MYKSYEMCRQRTYCDRTPCKMISIDRFLVVVAVVLLPSKGTEAFGWGWFWPTTTATTTTASTSSSGTSSSAAVASVYNISIGNRENTNAELTDYGTMINNLQINLARFNGSALTGEATENLLNEAIYTVVDGYRNESETVVTGRLAWIDEAIRDIVGYARELRRDENNRWLKEFPEHVRANVAALNETTRSCLEREVLVEDLIQAVDNRSRNGCLERKLLELYELREAANNNLTEFLALSGDIEDRLEVCANPDFVDEISDLYQEACVSSVLLEVEMESLKLGFTVGRLTAAAEPVLSQAKAGLLECVADLALYAFNASLGLRHWINACTTLE